MSSYTAETVPGLDRASSSLPSPPQTSLAGPLSGRHPRAVRRHLPQPQGGRDRPQADRTGPPSPRGGAHRRRRRHQGADLFGDYVEKVWWPAWKAQHPDSAYQTGKRIEKRILPFFGNTPFAALDADQIGTWKASLVAAGLRPSSVNSYLSLLGTILNAAVDSDYLADSPLMRRSRAGRVAAAKNLPVTRREVWVTRSQLDTLGYAIAPRYQALVTVAALTGMRWGELAALRWDDLRLDRPLDDGAVAGPGRLHVTRAFSDPRRSGNGRMKGPKSEAGRRTIALDQETCNTLHQHREQFGDELHGLVFTTPGGSRGRGGPLAANNFRRVWLRALE